jgi:uncharacterized protein YbjT (DUF2867 family)
MIVVTGATGRFGSAVVRTLRSLDLPVRTMVRKGSHYYWLNDTGCGYFFGDLRDPQSVRRCLQGASHLVVANNIRRETKANNHVDVTIGGQEQMFQIAAELGIERVVLVSCMGVDQSDAPAFVARKAAEEALIQSGAEYTILRACIHEHALLELAWEIHDKGSLRLPGPGTNQISPLPTGDLARMAAASLDLDSARNQVINVGGADRTTFSDALALACEVVGTKPSFRPLPSALVGLGSRIGKPFRRFANEIAEQRVWCSTELIVDPGALEARFGFSLSNLRQSMENTNTVLSDMRDPERRDARMVHPQFYAKVYEPGTADLNLLPDGPAPRRD